MPKFLIFAAFAVESADADEAERGMEYALGALDHGGFSYEGIRRVQELNEDGTVIVPDDEKCVECSEPYTEKDIGGGRCLSCGAMICAERKTTTTCDKCGSPKMADGSCSDQDCFG